MTSTDPVWSRRWSPPAWKDGHRRSAPTDRPQRDYLHVSDAVAAYLAIEGAVKDGPGRGEAFNAGTGEPHSVREVIDLIAAEAAREGAIRSSPTIWATAVPQGEIDRQFVDASRLTGLTGWEPKVNLAQGIAEAVAWYRAPTVKRFAGEPGRSALLGWPHVRPIHTDFIRPAATWQPVPDLARRREPGPGPLQRGADPGSADRQHRCRIRENGRRWPPAGGWSRSGPRT